MTPNANQVKINIEDTTEYVCTQCENNVFLNGFYVRKISRLITGATTDGVIPVSLFVCAKCGKVADDLLPESLQKKS